LNFFVEVGGVVLAEHFGGLIEQNLSFKGLAGLHPRFLVGAGLGAAIVHLLVRVDLALHLLINVFEDLIKLVAAIGVDRDFT